MAGTILSAIGLIFVGIGTILAYKQLRGAALNSILAEWGSQGDREDRRFVITHFKSIKVDRLEALDETARKKVESVLAKCDRISFMANKVTCAQERRDRTNRWFNAKMP